MFRPGDLLSVSPYKNYKAVKTGDVIAFSPSDGGNFVVHRIIGKFTKNMFKTRGDYNLEPDDCPLAFSHIIGKVVTVQKGKRKFPVSGGIWGIFTGLFYSCIRRCENSLTIIFQPLYLKLAKTGWFYFLLRGKTRMITLKRPQGIEYQILFGKKIIGRLLPKAEKWEIKRPFRLFIDESGLPCLQKKQSLKRNIGKHIDQAKIIHGKFKLAGPDDSDILDFPASLISYLNFLLKNEIPGQIDIDMKIWHDFLKALGSHAITAFLYKRVAMLPGNLKPPEEIVNIMRNAYLMNSARIMQRERQLGKIKKAFKEKNIPFLVLKGLATAFTAYTDPATRISNDIDLLVHPDFFTQARQILIRSGYDCASKNFENFKDVLCEETFIHKENPDTNCIVELHWDIQVSFGEKENKIPVDELFLRSVTFSTPNNEFKTLSPLDSFINAAIHIILTHCTKIRFMWICDIARIGGTLCLNDWDRLVKTENKVFIKLISIALNMAKFWTGYLPPKPYDEFFEFDPEDSDLPPEITNALGIQNNDPKVCMDFYFSKLRSPADKIKTTGRLIFPSAGYMRSIADDPEKPLVILYSKRWLKWIKRIMNPL